MTKSLSKSNEPQFSDELLREIFTELTTKYKDESERQHLIRTIIVLYEKKYPAEMRAFNREMQKKRELMENDMASTSNREDRQRLMFKFPESLMKRLNLLVEDPPFLSQSNPMTKEELAEWTWFMKEFPEFVVPRKI